MIIAVNFHYIREQFTDPYPSIFGVTPLKFAKQLDALQQGGTTFLGIDDIIEIIDDEKTLPKRAVVITFDDGFKEQFELAWPILQRKGIPAIFYINTKPIEEDFVTLTHKIHIIRAHTEPKRLLYTLKKALNDENIDLPFTSKQTATDVYKYDTPENAQLKYFLN
jgi:hypothetical protein